MTDLNSSPNSLSSIQAQIDTIWNQICNFNPGWGQAKYEGLISKYEALCDQRKQAEGAGAQEWTDDQIRSFIEFPKIDEYYSELFWEIEAERNSGFNTSAELPPAPQPPAGIDEFYRMLYHLNAIPRDCKYDEYDSIIFFAAQKITAAQAAEIREKFAQEEEERAEQEAAAQAGYQTEMEIPF